MDTPANRAGDPKADASQWVQPSQVAAMLVHLASDAGAQVTGRRDSGLRQCRRDMQAAEWFVGCLTAYGAAGLVFAVAFVVWGIRPVDPVAAARAAGLPADRDAREWRRSGRCC